jgi:predicted amino acid racemase
MSHRPVQKPNLARTIAAARDSRFLTAEAVRNDKILGMREDSLVEISCLRKKLMLLQKPMSSQKPMSLQETDVITKTDVIPNRAESPVRNLLFAADGY